MKKKITLIGAGQIGGTLAHLIIYFIIGITNSGSDLKPEGHFEVIVFNLV